MRKMLTGFVVALCTFTLGLAFPLLFTTQRPAPRNSKASPCADSQVGENMAARHPVPDQPAGGIWPPLNYCEAINNSDCLSGKLIRMRATLSFDEHGMYVHDDDCDGKDNRTAVKLAKSGYDDEFHRMLGEACGTRCGSSFTVVVVGKLHKVTPTRESNLLWDTFPLRFEMERAEEARKTR
jgi:hypothetical protein